MPQQENQETSSRFVDLSTLTFADDQPGSEPANPKTKTSTTPSVISDVLVRSWRLATSLIASSAVSEAAAASNMPETPTEQPSMNSPACEPSQLVPLDPIVTKTTQNHRVNASHQLLTLISVMVRILI